MWAIHFTINSIISLWVPSANKIFRRFLLVNICPLALMSCTCTHITFLIAQAWLPFCHICSKTEKGAHSSTGMLEPWLVRIYTLWTNSIHNCTKRSTPSPTQPRYSWWERLQRWRGQAIIRRCPQFRSLLLSCIILFFVMEYSFWNWNLCWAGCVNNSSMGYNVY